MKKVYGVYPGNIKDLDEIQKLSEVELFLAISSLDNYILMYKRVSAYNMSRSIDITDDEYALEYLINQTQNFGVELEKDEDGKVIKSGEFVEWYQYYMRHFNKVLSKEEFIKFLELKSQGYNVSKYLPNDSYLEYKKRISISTKNSYIKIPV